MSSHQINKLFLSLWLFLIAKTFHDNIQSKVKSKSLYSEGHFSSSRFTDSLNIGLPNLLVFRYWSVFKWVFQVAKTNSEHWLFQFWTANIICKSRSLKHWSYIFYTFHRYFEYWSKINKYKLTSYSFE